MKKIKMVIGVLSLIGLLGLVGCKQATDPAPTEQEKLEARITEFNKNFIEDIKAKNVFIINKGRVKGQVSSVSTSGNDTIIVIESNDQTEPKTRAPVLLKKIELKYNIKHVSEKSQNLQYALVDIVQKRTLKGGESTRDETLSNTPVIIVHKADEYILYDGTFELLPIYIFTTKDALQPNDRQNYERNIEMMKFLIYNIFNYYDYYKWNVVSKSESSTETIFEETTNKCSYNGSEFTLGDVKADLSINFSSEGSPFEFTKSTNESVIKNGEYIIEASIVRGDMLTYGTPVYYFNLVKKGPDTTECKFVIAEKGRLTNVSTGILVEED